MDRSLQTDAPKNQGGTPRLAGRSKTVLSFLVLALGLVVTLAAFVFVRNNVQNEASLRFEREASDALHSIEARVNSYTDIVFGLRALFYTTDQISVGQFHKYVSGLDLPRRFPGFLNLNYAEHVPGNARSRFEAKIRNDPGFGDLGYPPFSIKPPGERSAYHIVIYLEPLAGNEASFGRDVFADLERREIFERQIHSSSDLSSSGRPVVIQGKRSGSGFIGVAMRLPVYQAGLPADTVEQRRAALVGTIGAGFRMRELMQNVLDGKTLERLRFRVFEAGSVDQYRAGQPADPKDERLLFDSAEIPAAGASTAPPNAERDSDLRTVIPLTIAGRVWEIHFSSPARVIVGDSDLALPWLVLGAGLLISLLLFGTAYSLSSARSRAVALAREITGDLKDSETSLAEAQRMAHLGNWSLDVSSGAMTWSDETYRIFGIAPHSLTPTLQEFLRRMAPEELPGVESALKQVDRDHEIEHRIALPNGSLRWVHTLVRPAGETGRARLHGTIMDVNDRKLTALRMQIEHRVTRLAASAPDTEELLPGIIQALCTGIGWECGSHWRLDRDGTLLLCTASWGVEDTAIWEFLALSKKMTMASGMDLPGRAWARGEAVFVNDIDTDPAFGRAQAARQAGLRGAVAFPVFSGSRFAGVIELFSRQVLEPDDTLRQLLSSVSSQIGQFFQRKHAEETLRFIATHDPLTELPNRGMFNDRLSHALSQSARYRRSLAVLFIDIDRFKLLNDTLGHTAGDRMLVACADRLKACLRESDIVARLGGDEFVVMVENFSDPRDAIAVAQKILTTLGRPFVIEGQELLVTASLGIATYPEDGADSESLLKNADIAMYRAKEQGRNNYQFYSPQMNKHTFERLAMESSLRRAIDRNEFQLHYQPKLDLRTGVVSGLEALVRWQHPDWGLVAPAQFIPLAEETGLITQVGEWVMQTAAEQNRVWREQGIPPLRVAVNLSARQFAQKDLPRDIARILGQAGMMPETLELEITESLVMQNAEQTSQTLERLKAMAISVAIDDFGTGYSSLAYLKRFPIDSVKIDRSFVKDIPNDADDMAITRGVIALAHSLRLRVVAEGVETPQQQEFMRANDCDEIQGYIFSRPLPAEEITSFLKTHFHIPHLKVVEPRRRA